MPSYTSQRSERHTRARGAEVDLVRRQTAIAVVIHRLMQVPNACESSVLLSEDHLYVVLQPELASSLLSEQ